MLLAVSVPPCARWASSCGSRPTACSRPGRRSQRRACGSLKRTLPRCRHALLRSRVLRGRPDCGGLWLHRHRGRRGQRREDPVRAVPHRRGGHVLYQPRATGLRRRRSGNRTPGTVLGWCGQENAMEEALEMGKRGSRNGGAYSEEWKNLVSDVEDLFKKVAHVDDLEIAEIRAKVQDTLQKAKGTAKESFANVRGRAEDVSEATDEYVHENPWAVIGIAAAVGIVIGFIAGRR